MTAPTFDQIRLAKGSHDGPDMGCDDPEQADRPSPLSGTGGDGLDEARGYLALDWLIRTYTPDWLDLAGLTVEATALRDLRRIADLVAAQAAGPAVRHAQAMASAAGAAAIASAAGAAAIASAAGAAGIAAAAAAAAARAGLAPQTSAIALYEAMH